MSHFDALRLLKRIFVKKARLGLHDLMDLVLSILGDNIHSY